MLSEGDWKFLTTAPRHSRDKFRRAVFRAYDNHIKQEAVKDGQERDNRQAP